MPFETLPFDPAALSRVAQPVETARGLPNAFYIDPATFELEKKAVLFDQWTGLGFAKDVPNPGDVRPTTFLGIPLLIARDKQGVVRVFQNVCRHRGMILVEEPKNIQGALRCPYHSWCYALDGRLAATPHVGGPGHNVHPDVKREELGLLEVRSHVWRDVIFVNVSGEAPPFEEAAAGLIKRWAAFDQPVHHGGADSSFKLSVATNWKLAVENYCESYHLPWVHPGLNSYSRLEDHYHIEARGAFSGQGTVVYNPDLGEKPFTDFADLGAEWAKQAEYIALYPNVLLGIHRDHAFAIVLEPTALDRTVEHIEIYYADTAMLEEDYAAARAKNAAMWKAVFEEDIFVVEGMQKGRYGDQFDGGKFSPAMDSPTHCFHAWVAERCLTRM